MMFICPNPETVNQRPKEDAMTYLSILPMPSARKPFGATSAHVFGWRAVLLTAALACLPVDALGIETLTETESRAVTAESGISFSQKFLAGLILDAATDAVARNQSESEAGDEPSRTDAEWAAAYRLLFSLTGLTEADVKEIVKHADIRAGQCDILTETHRLATGTDGIINGFTIGLPVYEIKTKAETKDLQVTVPGATNSGGTLWTVQQEAGSMKILGGTVEVSGHLPEMTRPRP